MTYRPYPAPAHPWIMHQRWHDLLFAHWAVDPDILRPLIPQLLQVDLYEGTAWIGIVPFWMSNVRPRGVPPVPGMSRFLELNVRTYVTFRNKPGVFFFSLDASNRLAVRAARTLFHLPYFDARMELTGGTWNGVSQSAPPDDEIVYASRRIHRGAPEAALRIRYRPVTQEPVSVLPATLPWWLTARYCLYTSDLRGRLYCGEIHHSPWPLHEAEAVIEENTMAAAAGVLLPDTPPVLHFSRRIDVQIWALSRCFLD